MVSVEFFIDLILMAASGPGIDSVSNRGEHQEYFGGGQRRPVHRSDNLTTFICRLSLSLEASISWNPQDLSRPIELLIYLYLYLTIDATYCYELIASWSKTPSYSVFTNVILDTGVLGTFVVSAIRRILILTQLVVITLIQFYCSYSY